MANEISIIESLVYINDVSIELNWIPYATVNSS